jgi:hypothetical protein
VTIALVVGKIDKRINNVDPLCGILLALCLLMPSYCIAAPLGLPQSTGKIGYSIGTSNVSLDDPSGATTDVWAAQPLNLIYTDWLVGDIRQWSELYYYKTTLEADDTNIGQNIERLGLRFSLQKTYRLTQTWSPWFGVGIDLSNNRYDTRHTKDSGGYLIEAYDDRDETSFSLLLNMLSEWSLQKDWAVGAKLEQSVPVNGDITEFTAAVTVLYRY